MITLENVLKIHGKLVENFGGAEGLRDRPGLESAVSRPLATFDGNELYPMPADKAAAILESIVSNHPFIDGNKRTGYVLMRLFLLNAGFDIDATGDEKYDFVIDVSKGDLDIDKINSWIKSRLKSLT